ncbi:hypothetical protein [uncultured Tateyamaria sp.]|uniref:hypothetical protein n=1 Tax=uncultured Tateyamaria sp. TaxID=455651 RepID=UPI002602483A|nr:hypothetical protein [uncultured Tateyamaria sp.]
MFSRRYRFAVLLCSVVVLVGFLVATDSPLAGRVLTRIEAHRLMDRFDEVALELHSIEGRGEKTKLVFLRAGDPVPLEPVLVNACARSECLSELSAALWSRDVQHEIADHIFDTFDECGLPPIAIPKIIMPWQKARSYDQRPVGQIFKLRTTVFLDTADIDADVSRFQRTAENCVQTLRKRPTENPGWALVTEDVGFTITALPLRDDLPRPAVRPVLDPGPYIPAKPGGTPIKEYGRTVNFELIVEGEETHKSLLTVSEHPALADQDIRVALKQPLIGWLREIAPDRNAEAFSFKASDMQEVPGSEGMGHLFVTVADPDTSKTAIVVALIESETIGQDEWQPAGFEVVAEFGQEAVLDTPPMHFDLEELPNE